MQFDVNRMLALSGLPADKVTTIIAEDAEVTEPDTLTESAKKDSPKILAETQLRAVIRQELRSILEDLKQSEEKGDASWIHYGKKKPSRSQPGRVSLGLLGVGFK